MSAVMFALGAVAGLVVGAIGGAFAMALCFAGRNKEEQNNDN